MAEVPVETLPDSPEDLWLLAHLFNANWSSRVSNTCSFQTSAPHSISAAEHRYGLMGKPVRATTVTLHAHGRSQVRSLKMLAQRAGKARHLFPLFSDATRLTTDATATDTSAFADTNHRRIFEGSRVVVAQDSGDFHAPQFEIREIESINTGTGEVAFDGGLTNNYPAGSYIIPLIESRLVTEMQGDVLTDETASVSFTAIEQAGGNQIGLIEHDKVWQTAFGLPIFDAPVDFARRISWGSSRLHSTTDTGIDAAGQFFGSKARETNRVPVTAMDREQAWDVIAFFESRRGRQRSFWMPSPLSEFTVLGASSMTITVAAAGAAVDWEFTKTIAVRMKGGTTHIRFVESVSRSGDEDEITLASAIPGLSAEDIDFVRSAPLMRLDSDEMQERWITDHVMECDLSMVEVLRDDDKEVDDLQDILTSPLTVDPCDKLYLLRLCCCHVECHPDWNLLAGEAEHDCDDSQEGPIVGLIRESVLDWIGAAPGRIVDDECVPPEEQDSFTIVKSSEGWCFEVLCEAEDSSPELASITDVSVVMTSCVKGDPDESAVCCCEKETQIEICAPGGCGANFSSSDAICENAGGGNFCAPFQGFGKFQAHISNDPPFLTCSAEYVDDSSTGTPQCSNKNSECRTYDIALCCDEFIEYEEAYIEIWMCCQIGNPGSECPIFNPGDAEECCTSLTVDPENATCNIKKIPHCDMPEPHESQ